MKPVVYYDSRDAFYKTPFGAVKVDEEIEIKIKISSDINAKGVFLILREDKKINSRRFCFSQTGADADFTIFSISFSVEREGIYFYRFEIETENGVLFIGKSDNSKATVGDFLPEWQLTVFNKNFVAPNINLNVMYQIFPDRFNKSNIIKFKETKNKRTIHTDWYERPLFTDNEINYEATDFFGGNFKGITEKIPYLKALGVTALYLNPIFESASNHRYNTGDFLNTDPFLGSKEDFKNLLEKMDEAGISIILDGVFSHTGSDSVYFNKDNHYDSLGAYQSENSPYYSWYNFSKDRSQYDCWWNFKTLPNINEQNESYLDFICGESGVLAYWMKQGVKGWRLDVADELPDIFIEKLRKRVKKEDNNAYIVGEVWEDASTKESYGQRRKYLLGNQLDSVMNYPWRTAILDFVKSKNAENFYNFIMNILENYPSPSINTLMNSLSTHDTVRAITYLSSDNELKNDYQLSPYEYEKGKNLFILASFLQYTLPGFPCLYYADEAGMTGSKDPFNRKCYPWGKEDTSLIDIFIKLGELRNNFSESFNSDIKFISASNNVVAFTRKDILTIINCSDKDKIISLKGEKILIVQGNCILKENNIIISSESGAIIKLP